MIRGRLRVHSSPVEAFFVFFCFVFFNGETAQIWNLDGRTQVVLAEADFAALMSARVDVPPRKGSRRSPFSPHFPPKSHLYQVSSILAPSPTNNSLPPLPPPLPPSVLWSNCIDSEQCC